MLFALPAFVVDVCCLPTHASAAVHAKDLAPEGQAVDEDGWTILGQGLLPWAELATAVRAHTELIVFEHDNPKDAEACLRGSLDFMRRAFA